jgi:hypothetical protein
MRAIAFEKLNRDWNAEPNVPDEHVAVNGDQLELSFRLNPWAFDAKEGEVGRLLFWNCTRWRLGATNDEGWYLGQCRYSKIAPNWGEFYEVTGIDPLVDQPEDWHEIRSAAPGNRHFIFYLRDSTFECIAAKWAFER